MDIIESYLKWFKENTHTFEHNNIVEIATPFLDRHNDYISIYAEKINNQIKLSDGGEIISDLSLYGFDLSEKATQKRKDILNKILKSFNVNISDENELFVIADEKNLPSQKHSLIQAIIAVDDLYVLNSSNILSLFFEEVSKYFSLNKIRATENIHLIGRSNFLHKFDFIIPSSTKEPERIIKLINKPTVDNIKSAMFSFEDTIKDRKSDSKQIIVFNDDNSGVIEKYKNNLFAYKIESFAWSQRESFKCKLAA